MDIRAGDSHQTELKSDTAVSVMFERPPFQWDLHIPFDVQSSAFTDETRNDIEKTQLLLQRLKDTVGKLNSSISQDTPTVFAKLQSHLFNKHHVRTIHHVAFMELTLQEFEAFQTYAEEILAEIERHPFLKSLKFYL